MPHQPERLLVLAKYRLQTEARDLMYGLAQIKRRTIQEIQDHHLELVKVHVNEFATSVKSAGAIGLRKYRLVSEMLRYGVDAFNFVENEYYNWVRESIHRAPRWLCTSQSVSAALGSCYWFWLQPYNDSLSIQTLGFLKQQCTIGANEFVMRCRAMYRIANVPRERRRFFLGLDRALSNAKADAVQCMDGWRIRKRDAYTAFCILTSIHGKLTDYFRDVMDNISAAVLGAGATFSVVVTQGGCGWAFGSSSHGQIGQGSLVRQPPCWTCWRGRGCSV